MLDFALDEAIDLAGVGNVVAALTSKGHIVLVSSKTGGRIERSEIALFAPGALCIAAGDVTGDGRPDLVVGTDHGELHVVPDRNGTWGEPFVIKGPNASHVMIADL